MLDDGEISKNNEVVFEGIVGRRLNDTRRVEKESSLSFRRGLGRLPGSLKPSEEYGPVLKRLQLISALRSRASLPFIFVSSPEQIPLDGFVARIPATISDVNELMTVFARELQFPGYFGENWAALQDCLRDLSWLSENRVVIYHEELPRSVADGDLAIYLDVLLMTVRERALEDPPERQLLVVFPEKDRDFVQHLLNEFE